MTQKQIAFCEYYIASFNATEAAKKAGYSEKTAYSQGQRMLKNVEVKGFIEEKKKEAHDERIANAEEVLRFFSDMMRNKGVSVKDRIRAAENLARRFGVDREESEDGESAIDSLVSALEDIANGTADFK